MVVVVVTSFLSLYPVGEAIVICQRGSAADGHYRARDCKHNLLHITHPEINFASGDQRIASWARV
jgi:hypothetical protein